jgi:hypothetical protein
LKRLLFIILFGAAAVAVADGPGSRIRATPEPAQPAGAGPVDKDLQRCEAMSGEEKERCLRALRSAPRGVERAPHEGPGPQSPGPGANSGTGATSGATGASTGTSGASSAVGGAR